MHRTEIAAVRVDPTPSQQTALLLLKLGIKAATATAKAHTRNGNDNGNPATGHIGNPTNSRYRNRIPTTVKPTTAPITERKATSTV